MLRWLTLSFLLLSVSSFAQDLITTSYDGPGTFIRYQEINFTCTVKNTGIVGISKQFTARARLSKDNIVSSGDFVLASAVRTGLGVGQSAPMEFKGNYDIPADSYYLIIELDYERVVAETDEDNNLFIVNNVTITPPDVDWKFNSLTVDSSDYYYPGDTLFHIGERIMPEYEIVNTGSTNTSSVLYNKFYLSSDEILDDTDELLGQYRHFLDGPDIFQGNEYSQYIGDFTVPMNISPGKYFVIGKADSGDDFDETDETDNVFISAAIAIGRAGTIDLSPTFAYASYDNGYFFVNYNILNNSNTGTNAYSVQACLSVDKVLSDDDFVFYPYYPDEHTTPYIGPNGSGFGFFGASSPYGAEEPPPGNYYLIFTVGSMMLPESNYGNNVLISSAPDVTVIAEGGQISITHATFTGTYDNTDTSFLLEASFLNKEEWTSDVFSFDVVIKDSTGQTVKNLSFTKLLNLAPGATDNSTIPLTLSSPLPFGQYDVTITCTSPYYGPGPFELELNIDMPTFAISGTIEGEDGVPINMASFFFTRSMMMVK